ncbi:ABC transporter permease [Butyrivibrio sp. VCD2006]|uniref:ABC transporter permease n=1 Tax=Butyrivibrio sp. VCD2006 TaxID=1280664 RepID=UPI00041014AD|nr:ABC transporter permease [Butyrivibrio sp. VCD2006]
MKKTQLKDALRNIKKQLVSWLSIIVISSFAVAAYLGLTYSAYGLSTAGKNLYESTNFRDIQISSNCMLSEDDLNAIKAVPGITDVEGVYRINAKIDAGANTQNVYVTSVPFRIGIPIISEGTLPSAQNECMLEENLAQKLGITLGDELSLTDEYAEDIPELTDSEFIITGIFTHAEHSTFDMDETYCVLVTKDAFDMEKLDNCYTLAEVTFDHSAYSDIFGQPYFDAVAEYVDALEELGKERAGERYAAHLSFLQDQIDDSKKELSSAEGELRLAGRMVKSMDSKTGVVMSDLSNMLSVFISEEPSEYRTPDEQISNYEDAKRSYDHAIKRVDDTCKRYEKMKSKGQCDWYVFNRNASADYSNLKNNAENLHSLNKTFAVLFVVIAIMVIFASLSRMVYEQKTQIGVSKALGMFAPEVFSKYLIFGLSSSILGIAVGIILSYTALEWVIGLGYADHFIFGAFPYVISPIPTIVTIVLAIIVALTSIYFSCSELLKKSAKKLLAPQAPDKEAAKLRNNPLLKSLSLYNRMIILNMRTDIVRILVTIISISGCCALIVIGFSLRFNIIGTINQQVDKYMLYDGKIVMNTNLYENALKEVSDALSSNGISYVSILSKNGSVQIDDTMEFTEFIITDDFESLHKFRPLPDQDIDSLKNGLVITNKLAEIYSLKPGDDITLMDDLGYKHPVTVSGIMDNNIGRFTVISKEYYEKTLNDTYKDNAFLIKLPKDMDTDAPEALISSLKDIEGFESYKPSSEVIATFESLVMVLNLIIGLLVVLAGVMALFVLLNLANMYLISKKTELTVMRINGFTEKETIGFCVREVYFTTVIGIILGIFFGVIMVHSILKSMEQIHLAFILSPNIPSCIFGAMITAIFVFVIYAKAMNGVKDLNLRDIK